MNEHVYTVSTLTKDIRMVLEAGFSEVLVEGEISNFRAPSSGHFYFSIKDAQSMIKCVIFRSANSRLKFDIEDGMKVLCRGRVSVYDKQGQYQLYVDKIDPLGEGALHVAFEKLKQKLNKEGLFDMEYKKELPEFIKRLGVITSPTGAAVRDIVKVAERRYEGIEITICPVKVQGEGAAEEIASAISLMNEYNDYINDTDIFEEKIDAVIVGRGGGSLEDLWAFNEEILAREIFASKIPVISAVGHEIDFTISDFTADHRAATPSAAAELAVPLKKELLNKVLTLSEGLKDSVNDKINILAEKVKGLTDSYVLREPINVILQLRQRLDDVVHMMEVKVRHCLELGERRLDTGNSKLCMLSPLAVLDRGYSITFRDGKVLKKTRGLEKKQKIVTRLAEGNIISVIDRIEEGETDGG
jgi:exodeoxyribonuclease VII large subunit